MCRVEVFAERRDERIGPFVVRIVTSRLEAREVYAVDRAANAAACENGMTGSRSPQRTAIEDRDGRQPVKLRRALEEGSSLPRQSMMSPAVRANARAPSRVAPSPR
jgi:hypothetical protein